MRPARDQNRSGQGKSAQIREFSLQTSHRNGPRLDLLVSRRNRRQAARHHQSYCSGGSKTTALIAISVASEMSLESRNYTGVQILEAFRHRLGRGPRRPGPPVAKTGPPCSDLADRRPIELLLAFSVAPTTAKSSQLRLRRDQRGVDSDSSRACGA